MGDFVSQFGGWLVGLVTVLGTIFYNNRKVKVEESDIILSRWKDFSDTHQADMKRLREEMDKDRTRYEAELEYLRERVKEVEKELVAVRKDSAEQILARDKEIAGLKRTISQISQSTAVQLGRVKRRAVKTDETVDTNETNNVADHDGIKEALGKLEGGLGDNSRRRRG